LKIETTPREDHQTTLTVEVEPEQLEAARRRAARQIAQKAKIPGFRPGKAPYDVIRRTYGEAAINEEAIELLVNDVYPQAIKEANLEPAAMGQLENVENDPPKFTFVVPLSPTVDLGDYKSVRVPYDWTPPTDAQLDEAIENLRRMYSSTETVERPAAEGDYLLVDVTGSKAGEEDAEAAPLAERNSFATLIRKEPRDDEWPFAGFAAKLIGTAPEGEISFTHEFPEDAADELLRGQTVDFKVKVKTVRGVNMPELDDDFVLKTGMGADVEELRMRMRQNLEAESRSAYDDKYFEEVIDQIKAGATIKYPPQVLDHEVEHVMEDLEHRLQHQGVENLEAYYKMVDTTPEKFREEQAKPAALKRLERGLIIQEITSAENIQLDEQSIEQEFQHRWMDLVMNDPEFSKRTKGGTKASRDLVDAVARDAASRLMVGRTLQKIKAIANNEPEETAEAEQPPVEAAETAEPAEGEASLIEGDTTSVSDEEKSE
jgi:trigger factor